jgi:tetratricopeptide (TPR) repeat protein
LDRSGSGDGFSAGAVLAVAAASFALAFGLAFAILGGKEPPKETGRTSSKIDTGGYDPGPVATTQPVRRAGPDAGEPFAEYGNDGKKKAEDDKRRKRQNELKTYINRGDANIESGRNLDAIYDFANAALLADSDDAANTSIKTKIQQALQNYESQRNREIEMARGSGGTTKSDPGPSPTPKAGTDPRRKDEARQAVARAEQLARDGKHHEAIQAFAQAGLTYGDVLPDGYDLAGHVRDEVAKVQTPVNITIDTKGNKDKLKEQAKELRKRAYAAADVKTLSEARELFTALFATGYYTSEDVARLNEIQRKFEKSAEGKTIFD